MRDEIALWEEYGPLFCFEEREIFAPDHREHQFYEMIRSRHRGSCLELGAGDGRIARSLPEGSLCLALEPSAAMLEAWPAQFNDSITRVRALAQNIPLVNDSMDLVLFPYNGLHCILDRNDRLRVLGETASILRRDGVFVAETCPQFIERPDEESSVRYIHENSGGTVRLVESVSHDRDRGRIFFDMEYSGSLVPQGRRELRLELATFSAGELLSDIVYSGMRILNVWGEYDLSPWDRDTSPRLIVMAGRRNS